MRRLLSRKAGPAGSGKSDKLKHVKTKAGIQGILDSLKPSVFFYATEDSQIRSLDALNKFIASKTKLDKALAAGMLDAGWQGIQDAST